MISEAARIADQLLSITGDEVVLHGDLHHDNIPSSSTRGWRLPLSTAA